MYKLVQRCRCESGPKSSYSIFTSLHFTISGLGMFRVPIIKVKVKYTFVYRNGFSHLEHQFEVMSFYVISKRKWKWDENHWVIWNKAWNRQTLEINNSINVGDADVFHAYTLLCAVLGCIKQIDVWYCHLLYEDCKCCLFIASLSL